MHIPGSGNLGLGVPKQQENAGITVKCAKSLGRKQKCLHFPPLCFIASPSTDFIWQVPFHGRQTHRPPRLLSRGPRWLLRGWITAALMEQLHYLSCFQALDWEGRPALLVVGVSICARDQGLPGQCPKMTKAAYVQGGSCLMSPLLIVKSPGTT